MEAKVEGKGTKILIAILIILILGAGAVLAYKIVQDKKNVQEVSNNENSSNILQATQYQSTSKLLLLKRNL